MEDGAAIALTPIDPKSEKMVAPNTNNAVRKAILEERKRQIEEKLSKCNQELKALCIQEAELTGITPLEMPLEIGETPPTIRRKVGTAFQLNESLLNDSNKDRLIADLELEIQVHMKMKDAALGLSNEGSSKTVKRQHRAEYQKHKEHIKILEEKLALLKEKAASEQLKQKKKSRVPEPQDDNVSILTNEPYTKQDHRHSQLSNKASSSMLSPTDTYPETRYPSIPRQSKYRNSDASHFVYPRTEETLTSEFYRLSLNGYNEYMERQEQGVSNHYYNYPSQNLVYNYPYPTYSQHSSPSMSQTHQMSQQSPHMLPPNHFLPHQGSHFTQHSPISQHSPVLQHSPQSQKHDFLHLNHSPLSQHNLTLQRMSQYPQLRQPSPTTSSNKMHYYPSHTISGDPMYNRYVLDANAGYRNTTDVSSYAASSLQPHQQYENNGMSSGLGGCWKRSESGQMYWVYSSNTLDGNWQSDKRFGSLDRRKNKRLQRKISPVDSKSATLATVPDKSTFVKPSQVTNRRSQDHRQLVRTQSLGSVGQTVDSVYPSDDTSSCESDSRSFKDIRAVRKQKEKEWMETSLDGPISPARSVMSGSQTSVVLTDRPSEEKYVIRTPPSPPVSHTPIPQHSSCMPVQHITRIQSPKSPLEIPAESNPRVVEPPNIELLNNNIPKNCTVVQAGVLKPYHEETKPFEMSDFYKYSTKFKKSPQKDMSKGTGRVTPQANLNQEFQEDQFSVKIQQQQYMQHRESTTTSTSTLNNSLDLTQITVSERFSEEMNAWYQNRENHENNNSRTSKSRSSATLV